MEELSFTLQDVHNSKEASVRQKGLENLHKRGIEGLVVVGEMVVTEVPNVLVKKRKISKQ